MSADALLGERTEVFGIRRFPIFGQDGCWMPVDVAIHAATAMLLDPNGKPSHAVKNRLYDEIAPVTSTEHLAAVERLAARYEAATKPPPPKWETALRESWLTSASGAPSLSWMDQAIEVLRTALAEGQA